MAPLNRGRRQGLSVAGDRTARTADRRIRVLAVLALTLLVASTIASGAWWGFPIQDDSLMIRLLRMGGPSLIVAEHTDRPVFGFLMASCARIAGEHRLPYVAIALLFWLVLAAEAALLWIRLFPEWSHAWPAVSLAVVAPVVTFVQFTTLTTVIPCVLPVCLVLAALLILLSGPYPETGIGAGTRIAAALLGACGAVISEYALAAVAAAATFLLMRRRWRSALTLLAGVSLGYVVFRVISDVTARVKTDPDVQLERIRRKPWPVSSRTLSAAWDTMVGSWGRAASDLRIDWDSKSTLLAACVALAAAGCVAVLSWNRGSVDRPDRLGGRLLAVIAAVIAGLIPVFFVSNYPLNLNYETRFFLPVLVFASCATVAGLLHLTQPRFRSLVLSAMVFLSADRLVLGAIEEKRLQAGLERVGDRLRPLVGRAEGLVVIVTATHIGSGGRLRGISPEERMAKETYRWPYPEFGRLWVVGPGTAAESFGPRSGCRRAESLNLGPREIRCTRADEPIRLVLWDNSQSDEPDLEPYFRGCPSQEPGKP